MRTANEVETFSAAVARVPQGGHSFDSLTHSVEKLSCFGQFGWFESGSNF